MTYDLAVWEGDRPEESDAAETFAALYDRYIGREDLAPVPPTPAIRAYAESLLDRWCEMVIRGTSTTPARGRTHR